MLTSAGRWGIIILLITIIVIWAISKPEPEPEQKIPEVCPKVELEVPTSDVYSEIFSLPFSEGQKVLEKKSQEAQKLIPGFPPLPAFWCSPPVDKGDFASLGERYTIESLETIFPGYHFKKERPDWLINPETGRRLELDGYCPELKIAVEYNGKQHYDSESFGIGPEGLKKQLNRDNIKVKMCNSRKICLLRIPYTVPLEKIPLAVYSRLLDSIPRKNLN